MAGIQALINQKTEERQGNPAPIYYRLANQRSFPCDPFFLAGPGFSQNSCIFYDITHGDNDVDCTSLQQTLIDCYSPSGPNGVLSTSNSAYQPAFKALPGWDFATGIGSVNAYNLAYNWPTSINVISGAPQTTTILTAFGAPLVVAVKDTDGSPVARRAVTFTAPSTGASAIFPDGSHNVTVNTDGSGIATSPQLTANQTAGNFTVNASAPSITGSVSFALSNTPGPPASITTLTLPQSAAVGTLLPSFLAVQVTDAGGNPVNGVTVTFAAPQSGASATFAGGVNTAQTSVSGKAGSAALTANGIVGTYNILATTPSVATTASFALANTATQPASLAATSGGSQSASIFTPFAAPLVATVKDALGNPVSGVIVLFGGPTVGPPFTGPFVRFSTGSGLDIESTNAAGAATSAPFTANGSSGSFVIPVEVQQPFNFAFGAQFPETNIAGPPAQIVMGQGSSQSASVGTTFGSALSVSVMDAGGNLLSGVPVTFTAPTTGASASFAGSNVKVVNTVSGKAASPLPTANAAAGGYTVVASIPGVVRTVNFTMMNVDVSVAQHSPGTVQITRGTPAAIQLDMASVPANAPLPGTISLSCSEPANLTHTQCTLNPQTFNAGYALSISTLTITTNSSSPTLGFAPPLNAPAPVRPPAEGLTALALAITVGLFAMSRSRNLKFRNLPAYLPLVILLCTALGMLSCGGGGGGTAGTFNSSGSSPSTPSAPAPIDSTTPTGPYTITVNISVAGGSSKAIPVNINVN
jgi:hypothetical protein